MAVLRKLFEHNDWANLVTIDACSDLTDEQLDATPIAGSTWTVRSALTHLVEAQMGYLLLLTLPPDARIRPSLTFDALRASVVESGAALLALVEPTRLDSLDGPVQSKDQYRIEPWVVMVQVINHATDHRRQVRGLLQALGVEPPDVDAWSYGMAEAAVAPIEGHAEGDK